MLQTRPRARTGCVPPLGNKLSMEREAGRGRLEHWGMAGRQWRIKFGRLNMTCHALLDMRRRGSHGLPVGASAVDRHDRRFEADRHNFLFPFHDRNQLVPDRLAVARRLQPVQPSAEPDFLWSGPADDHHLVVDINLHARIIDLYDQSALWCLDPQDRGHEVRHLAQPRGLGGAQSRQGEQNNARGHGQSAAGTARDFGSGHIEFQARERRPGNGGNGRAGNGLRLLDVSEPALQQVGNLGGGLEAIGRVLGEQAVDHGFKPVGEFWVQLADRPVTIFTDPFEDGQRRTARNGGRPPAIA